MAASQREGSRSGALVCVPSPIKKVLTPSLRLLPHDQDTGGFFVCVLTKAGQSEPEPVAESSSSAAKRMASPNGGSEAKRPKHGETNGHGAPDAPVAAPAKKFKRDLSFKEDPFSFVDPAQPEIQSIV